MSKPKIKIRREELVWEIYESEFTERDWFNTLDWLKSCSERGDRNSTIRYNAIKHLTFDEICAIFQGEKDDIEYQLGSDELAWDESVTELLKDFIRQDAWDYGTVDCYPADDSTEEFSVIGRETFVV